MKKKLFLLPLLALALAACNTTGTDDNNNLPGDELPEDENNNQENNGENNPEEKPNEEENTEPLTVEISGKDVVWMDEKLILTSKFNQETTHKVEWTSSDESVATVSKGIVSPKKVGKTVITVKSTTDETVKDELEIEVKDSIINLVQASDNWDVSGLKTDTPVLNSKFIENEDGSISALSFITAEYKFSGTVYYAEATFTVKNINYVNEWNRISIGHSNGDVIRAFSVSYGSDSSGSKRKSVVMEQTPTGSVTWGGLTDSTQVWAMGGRLNWDFSNIKIATIRNGNEYYYFVNNKFVWREVVDNRFVDQETIPTITVADMNVSIKDIYLTTNMEEIQAKLDQPTVDRNFYATYTDYVEVNSDESEILFNNVNAWPCTNMKDFGVYAMGDTTLVKSGYSFTVSYDWKPLNFTTNDYSVLGLTLRNAENGKECLSVLLGENKLYGNGWNWDGGYALGSSYIINNSVVIEKNKTYKVEIKGIGKYVDGNFRRDFKVFIDGVDTGFAWGDWYGYGDVKINITSHCQGAIVSNLNITTEKVEQ